ncbi:hypothetical protein EBS67_18490, partial [bacterium]|nr:hypothetical protein [bacterium]
MVDLTRKQFLSVLAGGLCLSNQFVQSVPNNNALEVPSYLKGYEAQYRINPRAAAIEWHRNAKWGMFIHYALHSLRGITA